MCEETIAKPDGRVMAHQPALAELGLVVSRRSNTPSVCSDAN
jgi:hypothetical protein